MNKTIDIIGKTKSKLQFTLESAWHVVKILFVLSLAGLMFVSAQFFYSARVGTIKNLEIRNNQLGTQNAKISQALVNFRDELSYLDDKTVNDLINRYIPYETQ